MDYFYWVLFLYLGLRDVVKRLVDIIGYICMFFNVNNRDVNNV